MAEKMSRRPPIAIILAVFLACVSVLLSVSFVMHPGSLSRFRRKNTAQGWGHRRLWSLSEVSSAMRRKDEPRRRGNIVVQSVHNFERNGRTRTGHDMKDLAGAVILAKLMGWSLAKPQGYDRDVSILMDASRLADEGASCGKDWPRVNLNISYKLGFSYITHLENYLSRSMFRLHVDENICVVLTNSFRIHPFQVYAWEEADQIRAGVYDEVIGLMRRALSPRVKLNRRWVRADDERHIVVHQRRGDSAGQSKTLRHFVRGMLFLAEQEMGKGLRKVAFHIVTEPDESGDVELACKSMPIGKIYPYGNMKVTCDVERKGTIDQDFAAMLAADVLFMTSSSLSTLAAYLGGSRQTVYYMPYIPYMEHSVIKVQFFTPCALPGRYNCLDLVGPNLDVRPCRCDAHEAHVLRMIGEETRFLAPNGSIKVDAEPAAGQLDEREIRLSNRKSFGLVQETEHDWERRQKVYKNMTAKIERNFNTLKAESGLKKLESSISVLKYLKRVRQPVTRCKNEARVGSLGDGGKWVCNPEAIKKSNDCLVYSVGSNEEYFFEEAIHSINPGCEIHTFDQTVDPGKEPQFVTHHKIGISSVPSMGENVAGDVMMRLSDITEMLGHANRTIHVLKIDCEGCEWLTASDWVGVNALQILVEVHPQYSGVKEVATRRRKSWDLERVHEFFQELDNSCYVQFHTEPNLVAQHFVSREFSFIKVKLAQHMMCDAPMAPGI